MTDQTPAQAADQERICGELRAELARQNLTRQDLADRLKVDRRWIYRRLSGEVGMTTAELMFIAGHLGLEVRLSLHRRSDPE